MNVQHYCAFFGYEQNVISLRRKIIYCVYYVFLLFPPSLLDALNFVDKLIMNLTSAEHLSQPQPGMCDLSYCEISRKRKKKFLDLTHVTY